MNAWLFWMLCFAGGLTFLITLAIGAILYALPRPRRFGFEVRNDD